MPRRAYETVHADTPAVYETHAATWDAHRTLCMWEAPWLARLTAGLEPEARVLDVGCGAGVPIAKHLISNGFHLTGVDQSSAMIAMCVARFPDHDWLVQDMRALTLDGEFDAIVGWDSFFHLNPDEQRAVLRKLAALLADDGGLLLTVGPEAGEVIGAVEGAAVYHASLSPAEYARILHDAGLARVEMTFEDAATGGRTLLLARRSLP